MCTDPEILRSLREDELARRVALGDEARRELERRARTSDDVPRSRDRCPAGCRCGLDRGCPGYAWGARS